MKNILIAIDDTKGTKAALSTFTDFCMCLTDSQVVLVYVEKLEGRSLMDEMLGEPELATLREAIGKTDLKAAMDRKAEKIFAFYRTALEKAGKTSVRTVLRSGHPAEEILAAAREENVDIIVVGSRASRSTNLFMGSVSREVAERSPVPVLLVKNPEQS
ncbi:MAG: universal stress protein [Candidatus Methylomirabilia bacterium]